MLNRILWVVVTFFVAFGLSACGDNAEKKVETKAAQEMQDPVANKPEPVIDSTNRSANEVSSPLSQSTIINPGHDVSDAAINTANQTASAQGSLSEQTA